MRPSHRHRPQDRHEVPDDRCALRKKRYEALRAISALAAKTESEKAVVCAHETAVQARIGSHWIDWMRRTRFGDSYCGSASSGARTLARDVGILVQRVSERCRRVRCIDYQQTDPLALTTEKEGSASPASPSTAHRVSSRSRLAISASVIDSHTQAAYLTFDARTSGIPLPHLSPTSTLCCLQTSCIYNAFASRNSTPTPSTHRGPTLPTS